MAYLKPNDEFRFHTSVIDVDQSRKHRTPKIRLVLSLYVCSFPIRTPIPETYFIFETGGRLVGVRTVSARNQRVINTNCRNASFVTVRPPPAFKLPVNATTNDHTSYIRACVIFNKLGGAEECGID